jgi:hypothetical protein
MQLLRYYFLQLQIQNKILSRNITNKEKLSIIEKDFYCWIDLRIHSAVEYTMKK